jgi:MFS family permease
MAGYLSDRYGVRKVALISMITFAIGMMLFSLNNGSHTLYLFLWGLLSALSAGTLPITFTKAISRWFSEKRGLALGIALVGTGIGGALAKLIAEELINSVGWRMAYVGIGFLPLIVALPIALFAFHAGRLVAGYLLDFIWAPAIASALMIMPAISMMMFAGADPSYSQMVIAIVLLGVAAGVEYDLLAYLVSRYFGVRSYARIYGALYALFGLGAGFGPAAFGAVYSNTGSYDQALYYSMWGFIICSLALLLLGRYRDEQLKAMV